MSDTVIHEVKFDPLPHQYRFLKAQDRILLLQGGIGSGKTLAGCLKVLTMPSGTVGTILAPTYPMLRDSTFRTFKQFFRPLIRSHNKNDNHTILTNGTEILWRSASDPDSLRGPNLNWSWLDEAAMMSRDAYNVMLGRIRVEPTYLWMTTTPRAVLGGKHWLRALRERKGSKLRMINARTADNIYLQKEYVEDLLTTYTTEHAKQELEGLDIDMSGPIMQREWVHETELPDRDQLEYCLGVDLASSLKTHSDNRAIVVTARHKETKQYYIVRVLKGRWTFKDTKRIIIETADEFQPEAIGVEKVAYQDVMIQELIDECNHYIVGIEPKGDKVKRFLPIAGKYEHGYIRHARGLDEEFLDELYQFPDGDHDDMVDALVYSVKSFEHSESFYS